MIQFFKKSFEQWFEIKSKIHEKKKFPRFLKLGDIFWYHSLEKKSLGSRYPLDDMGGGVALFALCSHFFL